MIERLFVDTNNTIEVFLDTEALSLQFKPLLTEDVGITSEISSAVKLQLSRLYIQLTDIVKLELAEGITAVCDNAFVGFDHISTIILPKTLKTINFNAFNLNRDSKYPVSYTVTYKGDFIDWSQITFNCIQDGIISLATNPMYLANVFTAAGQPLSTLNLAKLPVIDNVCHISDFAFVGSSCTGFETKYDPQTSVYPKLIIGQYAFAESPAFDILDFTVLTLTEVILKNNVFDSCHSLQQVCLPLKVIKIGTDCFKNVSAIIHLQAKSISNTGYKKTSFSAPNKVYWGYQDHGITNSGLLWKRAFNENTVSIYGYKSLEKTAEGNPSLVIPDMIEGFPVTTIEPYAFANAPLLDYSISIESSNIHIKKYAFSKCPFTDLTLPGDFIIDDFVFKDCHNLTSIKFNSSVKDTSTFGIGAFCGCANLKNFGTNTSGVYGKYSLEYKSNSYWCLLENITKNEKTIKTVCHYWISPETSSTSFNLTSKDSSTTTSYNIAPYAFYGNNLLKSFTLSSNIKCIGKSAFERCENLTNIQIVVPSDPDSILTIEENAFKDCISIAEICLSFAAQTDTPLNDIAKGALTYWCSINFKNKFANPLYYDITNIEDNFQYPKCLRIKVGSTINDTNTVYSYINVSGFAELTEFEAELDLSGITVIPACTFINSKLNGGIKLNNNMSCIAEFAFKNSTLNSITNNQLTCKFIGRSAFEDTKIAELSLTAELIQDYAFKNMTELEKLIIGNTTKSIGHGAFSNSPIIALETPARYLRYLDLTELKELTLIEDGSSLTDNSFKTATKLESLEVSTTQPLTLFSNVTALAFKNCTNLNYISYDSDVETMESPMQTIASNCILKQIIGNPDNELQYTVVFGANRADPLNISLPVVGIEDFAFSYRNFVTKPVLPAELKYVGRNIFKTELV